MVHIKQMYNALSQTCKLLSNYFMLMYYLFYT